MFIIALTVTILIAILVFVVSIGLVLQKVMYEIRSARNVRLNELYQQKLDPILLEDLPPEAVDPDSMVFRQHVKRLCEPLRLELQKISPLARRAHRAALKQVMFGVGRELAGETLARLILAFQILGFVDDELHALGSRRWWVQARACRNLGLMRAGDATADLTIFLKDEQEDVRTEAAMALVSIGGVKALDPLFTNLHRISVWMSIQLSKAVLSMGSRAVPSLVEGLSSESVSVQGFCIEMSGEIGDITACSPLVEFSRSADPMLRSKALLAIGKLGDEQGMETLLEHLSDEQEQVRINAARGLGFLASPETAPFLKEHLLRDSIQVRLTAGKALTRIESVGLTCLREAFRETDAIGKRIVNQFLEELGLPEEDVREHSS